MASLRGIAFSSSAVSNAAARSTSPLMITSTEREDASAQSKRRSADAIHCVTCNRLTYPRYTAKCFACDGRRCSACLFVCDCGQYFCDQCVTAHGKDEAQRILAKAQREAQQIQDEVKEFLSRLQKGTSKDAPVQEITMAVR